MFNDVIKLIFTTSGQDEDGFPIVKEEKTEILVNKKSVTRNEFYTAKQSGYNPSIVFEAWEEDFDLSKRIVNDKSIYADKVEYEGCKYDIIRTYVKGNSLIELTCG